MKNGSGFYKPLLIFMYLMYNKEKHKGGTH